jgi:hypothetical protein
MANHLTEFGMHAPLTGSDGYAIAISVWDRNRKAIEC